MSWATIRPVLKSLVAELSGLTAHWEDQKRPFVPSAIRALALLSVSPVTPVGVDDIVIDYDADRTEGQEICDNVLGVRNFTLSVKVESYEQGDALAAVNYLENLRNRLKRRSTGAALRAVGVAIRGTEPSRDLSALRDDRWTSIAVLDIRLRMAVSETDAAHGYSYIETVEITGPT
jgi:hypothetical protein